jgi:indolepyruvate ferredoxin oxidoreductase beta subunit
MNNEFKFGRRISLIKIINLVMKMAKDKRTFQAVLAGVGGQGIIYLNRVIAKAAMDLGYKVYCLEEHGMARRGGSVATYIRFGDEIFTPVIPAGTSDLLIGFELIETVRQLPMLNDGATVILNPELIPPFITSGEYPDKNKLLKFLTNRFGDKNLVLVDAKQLAAELGSQITMNMVLLGAASGSGVLDIDKSKLVNAIKSTSLPQYTKINTQAFESGFKAVK